MKNIARLRLGGIFLAVALIGWVSFSSTPMEGQTTGNNAVYDSGGTIPRAKGLQPSLTRYRTRKLTLQFSTVVPYRCL